MSAPEQAAPVPADPIGLPEVLKHFEDLYGSNDDNWREIRDAQLEYQEQKEERESR